MLSATMASILSSTWSGGWTRSLRYDRHRRGWDWNGKKTRRVGSPLPPAVASPTLCSQASDPRSGSDLKILKIAREKFAQEISFKSEDKDVSLARALLYIAAEDEAFMAFHRDMDMCSFVNERKEAAVPFKAELEVSNVEDISLAGKSVFGWLNELDIIAKEVEAELVSRDIGCHLEGVLEVVNAVLFESRGFKRLPAFLDSKFSYLHMVLSCGCGSAIMLSIIYIEVCRRLGIIIVGSCVGEDFLIWPQTGNPEELFRASSGCSLFAMINGSCVQDPRSKASDLNSKSLLELDIATNRDIIGIALANLIRLHWKRASRANWGLMLTSPLRPVHPRNDKANMVESMRDPLFRPQELRLAIMASERLLILQPHNWRLRRDHGMLLYFNRRYGEAVQELSICMAFAPVEEAEVLEPFVEKLHLLRLLSSWESWEQAGSVAIF
ncbi:hypothetical protein COCNU_10G010480 [Cocos nucifera]|uniref:Protein SirB1 N-terminal domain-containing protein n=1 Tax=Cocos nucifera TaxID=13894 RepID=A0A8K0N9C5_COCNU|nr:hypothetical protein COCNU_10G010480 [Cocos nucifera]